MSFPLVTEKNGFLFASTFWNLILILFVCSLADACKEQVLYLSVKVQLSSSGMMTIHFPSETSASFTDVFIAEAIIQESFAFSV